MKTISLAHPVRVYFKDGECHHDSATIMIANGFPSFVRGRGPDVIYPWENIRHVIRVADEPAEPRQPSTILPADIAVNLALKVEDLKKNVAAWQEEESQRRVERNAAQAEAESLKKRLANYSQIHTEHRLALRAALGLRDDEATDNVTGDFKALCERVTMIRQEWSSLRTIGFNKPSVDLDRLAAALGIDDADVDFYTMLKRVERLRAERLVQDKDLASITEQRDVLKRQLEELRADMRAPALPQPKQVDPGGPIWVRVVDMSSKRFGLVGRLVGVEEDTQSEEQRWHVELEGGLSVLGAPTRFAVIGTGRQVEPDVKTAPHNRGLLSQTLDQKAKSFRENNPSDTEHQQAQNRDKWRATCLAYGAKDCTVYFGPGSEMTLVVELKDSYRLEDVRRGLYNEHGLRPDQFTLREVRPIVDGVKPSAFKHPADNGQP